MRGSSRWWRVPLALLPVLLLAFATKHVLERTPRDVTVDPAIQPAAVPRPDTARVAGAGVVEPAGELVAIAPGRSGVVVEVAAVTGREVHKGDMLFRLDEREQSDEIEVRAAALRSAQAAARLAEAELRSRRDSLDIYASLGDARFVVREKLQERTNAMLEAQARRDLAQARVSEAEAGVLLARRQRELLTVRSPIDATVLQVRIRVGEFATATRASEPLVVLGRTKPLHVRIDIDEADAQRLVIGSQANIVARGAAGRSVGAAFVRVEPLLVPKRSLTNAADERIDTRVMQVIFALPQDVKDFFVGQQVDAFLPAR